jgi:putative ABC transport system permease protein
MATENFRHFTHELALALRYAWRELRHGLQGFRLFILCLLLGIVVIATVGLLSEILQDGLERNAKSLLGGDYEFYQTYRPMTDAQQAFINSKAALSLAIELRTIAQRGEQFQLVELKTVDDLYPLYGEVELSPPMPLEEALTGNGMVVEPELLERFNLAVGDALQIGGQSFTVRAVITKEPDRVVNTFSFGPRALMREAALRQTTLLQPGSLVRYRYRVALNDGVDGATWIEQIRQNFPDAPWRIRDFKAAAPQVERVLNNLTLFLTLTGLTALLAGGAGIANSTYALLQRKYFAIATLKSLGATNRLVFMTMLLLILLVTVLTLLAALGLAVLLAWQGTGLIQQFMDIGAVFTLYAQPLWLAAAYGFLIVLSFSLWQLGALRHIEPAAIFRGKLGLQGRPSLSMIMANIFFALLLVILAIVTAQNQLAALLYVVGSALTILVFWGCSRCLIRASSRLRPKIFWLRYGLASLGRPGARTTATVMSLGIGLTFLVGVSLIDANIQRSIKEIRPQDAPTHFFIDIQPDQRERVEALLRDIQAENIQFASMVRGNIEKLNGLPVAEVEIDPEVRWAVRGDRGISDAITPPPGTEIAEGAWWPEDYRGAPQVSFDQRLAKGMGLKLGDTITYNLLGDVITAEITSLRVVDYQNFRMNFSVILSPGILDAYPRSYLATASLPAQTDLLSRLGREFPNVSPIAVDRAVAQVTELSNDLAMAIRATAIFTVLSALIVLIGALVANEERRSYDIVVLKTLGAARRDIFKSFLTEYAGIALIAGIVSVIAGTVISWYVLQSFRFFTFELMPHISLTIMAVTLIVILSIGLAIMLRSYRRPTTPYLRNE